MIYEKATAELVIFDNFDVITTSGLDGSNLGSGCKNNGQDNGNGCKGNSGACSGGFWKQNW